MYSSAAGRKDALALLRLGLELSTPYPSIHRSMSADIYPYIHQVELGNISFPALALDDKCNGRPLRQSKICKLLLQP